MICSFRIITKQKGIELRYNNYSNVDYIFVDEEKLKDTLNNLLKNAYKFTEKGSIEVGLSKNKNDVLITVKDTGIGMPQKVLKNIFDRFKQVESSMTRQYEGSGLGLAIAKDSVAQMHGDIYVDSIEGQGSTFTVRFPADLEARATEAVKEG